MRTSEDIIEGGFFRRNKEVLLAATVLLAVFGLVAGLMLAGRSEQKTAAPVRGQAPALPADLTVGHQVLGEHPFDAGVWTQGLDTDPLDPNRLLVSAGSADGTSPSRIWFQNLETGEKSRVTELPCYGEPHTVTDPSTGEITNRCVFAEGAAFASAGTAVWQLTWTDGVAYLRSPGDLSVQGVGIYGSTDAAPSVAVSAENPQAPVVAHGESGAATQQGWGVCSFVGDEKRPRGLMVTSDGTADLRIRDVSDFTAGDDPVTVHVPGTQGHQAMAAVSGANELACGTFGGAQGIWANMYPGNQLAFISMEAADRGAVRAVVDLGDVLARQKAHNPAAKMPNGVAVLSNGDVSNDEKAGTAELLVTGKQWDRIYRIKVDAPKHQQD